MRHLTQLTLSKLWYSVIKAFEGGKILEYNEKLLEALINETSSNGEFVYITEWLGWLPYGQYQWIEITGKKFSLLTGWDKKDLNKLTDLGLIKKIEENFYDDDKTVIKYKLNKNVL
jgi:hypothetical protein